MSDFEGMRLFEADTDAGALFMLKDAPTSSAVARLEAGAVVEIRAGVRAVVVRGIAASDYLTVFRWGPELANRGLDIFAFRDRVRLSLQDVRETYAAWWVDGSRQRVVRVVSALTATFGGSARVRLTGPDGSEIVAKPEPAPMPWQESLRYFRESETTDDLLDAFRNVYLALESILSVLEPVEKTEDGRPAEQEARWFKRALRVASSRLDLNRFAPQPDGGDLIHAIYNELHNEVRNRVFHAKDGLGPFVPHSLIHRAQVSEAKDRYGRLYLALAEVVLGAKYRPGGSFIHPDFAKSAAEEVVNRLRIVVTSDPAVASRDESAVSTNGDPVVPLLSQVHHDATLEPGFVAVMGTSPVVALLDEIPAIGRFAAVDVDGNVYIYDSLGGRLALRGFDRAEVVVAHRVTGTPALRSVYAT